MFGDRHVARYENSQNLDRCHPFDGRYQWYVVVENCVSVLYFCIVRIMNAQLVQETRWCQTTRPCRAETRGDQERIPAERRKLMLSLQTARRPPKQTRSVRWVLSERKDRIHASTAPSRPNLDCNLDSKMSWSRRPTAKAVKASPLVQIQIVSKLLHCGSLD